MSRRRTGFYLIYLLAAFVPWILLGIQEHIRSSPGGHAIPLFFFSIFTLFHAASLIILLFKGKEFFQRDIIDPKSPSLDLKPGAPNLISGTVFILLLIPIFFGFVRNYRILWHSPINPLQGDLLPLIQYTLRDFWRDHQNPYHFHRIAHWQIPLTYHPSVWLPFSFPYLFGVDIRLFTLGSLGMLGVLMPVFTAFRMRVSLRSKSFGFLYLIVPAAIPIFLFHLPVYREFFPSLHLSGHWLYILGLGICTLYRFHFGTGLFLGLCLASRPYFVVLLPFYFLYGIFHWREEKKGVLLQILGLAIPSLILILPFLLHNPRAYLFGVLEWYQQSEAVNLVNDPQKVQGLGLSGILFKAGLYQWKFQVAALFQIAVILLSLKRLKTPRQLILAGAVALFFMLYLSYVPYFYTYVDPLILMAVLPLYVDPEDQHGSPGTRKFTSRAIWSSIAVFPALLGLLVFLFHFNSDRYLSKPVLYGNKTISKSMNTLGGFAFNSWVDNNEKAPRKIIENNSYVTVPLLETNDRELQITLESMPCDQSIICRVYLNGERLGRKRLASGEKRQYSFPIPRQNLFIGNNLVHIELMGEEKPIPANLAGELELTLSGIEFKDPEKWIFWAPLD